MERKGRHVLAAKFGAAVALAAAIGAAAPTLASGLPVFDAVNASQSTISAIESVSQTLKQIEQYRTQLQQYENMLRNTASPATHIWDQAQRTMTALRGSIDTLNHYKTQMGNIDAYLREFKDTAGYQAHPCYSVNGCTQAQWDAMKAQERLGSEAQKKANDALFRGIDQQQDSLETDAHQLERLQASAQGATGQMQAIGYANQLASHQSNQLLQIRGLLLAQQNAIATRNQVLADREAKEAANAALQRAGTFQRSPVRTW
ncbi:P-type conjugative transfer protein TrbJ [Massilia soli]|uniref:P-type conjugative transfer protein TrbJ n=1 Tax=Massilia soli TaxID=2792854 RepID=A0ABS7SL66_9BURK|nr:P-type conjugative transfer protein TrbJ [Massilia soli]MBZ2206570.1 P-type conjugative transfer protein TrbJ [Massilia soli]